ncbi:hypothetical protein [Bacillus toyonensis]|uniref:hypothetical protein n=1 Tax=Bacillus toyonensis TaxID=155322 RepID=UPI000BF066E4|nr:hypothetical protein [Bacillus toyonensis]PEI96816.1 hypothetical protein CN671_27015 [Bacillus toyonensis]
MTVTMSVYTKENIGSKIYANYFFNTLQNKGLTVKKIALYEPINKEFTIEKAVEMWNFAEPGCYDEELDALIGTAGGLIGKGQGFSFMVNWWNNPKEASINYLDISFQEKTFNKYKDAIIIIFKEITLLFNALYGYISEENAIDRQHVTGTLKERIPGIFWCNYFGDVFAGYIGKEKLNSFHWFEKLEMDKGILTFIGESPQDDFLQIEKQIKNNFGLDLFNGQSREYPNL